MTAIVNPNKAEATYQASCYDCRWTGMPSRSEWRTHEAAQAHNGAWHGETA